MASRESEFLWNPKVQSNAHKHDGQAATVLLDGLALTVYDESNRTFISACKATRRDRHAYEMTRHR
jgi:hypothetical protein